LHPLPGGRLDRFWQGLSHTVKTNTQRDCYVRCQAPFDRSHVADLRSTVSVNVVPSLSSDDLLRYATYFGLAFGIAALLTPVVARCARAYGFIAMPRQDRWHKKPTALLGGVAIYTASTLVMLTFVPFDRRLLGLLVGGALLFATGLVDDFRRLRPHTKLIAHVHKEYIDLNFPKRPPLLSLFQFEWGFFIHQERIGWIGKHIPRADAKWIGSLLAKISPDQIRDAFRAAGYSPEDVEANTQAVLSRIHELDQL